MIQAELRIAAGNKQGNSISLPQGKFLVGREEDCHLRPNSDLVSRHHCVFTVDDFSLRLRDLGSTNGTFVNGQRLVGAVNLKQGDRVLIGKLDFEVMIVETSSVLPSASKVDTVMIAGSPEAASESTQFAMPVLDLSAATDTMTSLVPAALSAAGALVPASADTQLLQQQPGMMPQPGMLPPGYGMPVGYPQQQPYMQQNPYGYPGYPPQMQMPQMGGYYGQPMGYPQMHMPQMMPPGYGMPQPGMMPQQMIPEPAPEAPAAASGSGLDVKLPDPSSTGAKAPAPPAAAVAAVPGAAPPLHIPTAAADIIKQYMTRR